MRKLKRKQKNILRETFGTLKEWKIDSQKVKDELRKEWLEENKRRHHLSEEDKRLLSLPED